MNRLKLIVLKMAVSAGRFMFTTIAIAQKSRINRTGLPALPKEALVVVFMPSESFPTKEAIEVGQLYSQDYEPDSPHTLAELVDILKEHARDNGANAIKITEIKGPGLSAICIRIIATIYRLDSIRNFERSIVWIKDRKLAWSDFKGTAKHDSSNSSPAYAKCAFLIMDYPVCQTNKIQMSVINRFFCNESWFIADSIRSPDVLAYQQLRFDISEVFARKCRAALTAAKLTTVRSTKEAELMYKKIYLDYFDTISELETETKDSRDHTALVKWRMKIDSALKELEEFSSSRFDKP